MMMIFLPLTLQISFHLLVFQFKCYGLLFTMLCALQVRAVLLPTKVTAELSCNSKVCKDLKDCAFCAFFFLFVS